MNTEQVKTAFPTERDCMLFLIKKRELKTRKDTIFENSKLPLQKWFLGIAYFNQHQKVTGQALSDFLDINYKSAYYMIQKLRKNNLQDFFQ
jgi:hypothetical protein